MVINSEKSFEKLLFNIRKFDNIIENMKADENSSEHYSKELFMLETFYRDEYLKLLLIKEYYMIYNFDLTEIQGKIISAINNIDKILDMLNFDKNIVTIVNANELPTLIDSVKIDVNSMYLTTQRSFINIISNRLSSHTAHLAKFGEVNPLLTKLEEQDTKLTEKIDLANSTIVNLKSAYSADALANSFEIRSKKLSMLSESWIIFLLLFILIISLFTFNHLPAINLKDFPIWTTDFNEITIEKVELLQKISIAKMQLILWSYLIYSPLALLSFWLIWFFSKNYFYTSKLRDEYKFKSDLSLAFNGYKQEIQEVDTNQTTNLLPQLLSGLITNICENPVKEKKKSITLR